MISLIGLFLFVLSQLIYDYGAAEYSTNWSIFYFSSTYLSFAIIAAGIIYKEDSDAIKYTALSMGLYFVFLIIMELIHVNVPFDVYMNSVNSTPVAITSGIVLSFLIVYISLKAWEKTRLKKS